MTNRWKIQCQQNRKEEKITKPFDIGGNKLNSVNILCLKWFEIFTEQKYVLKVIMSRTKILRIWIRSVIVFLFPKKPTKQQHWYNEEAEYSTICTVNIVYLIHKYILFIHIRVFTFARSKILFIISYIEEEKTYFEVRSAEREFEWEGKSERERQKKSNRVRAIQCVWRYLSVKFVCDSIQTKLRVYPLVSCMLASTLHWSSNGNVRSNATKKHNSAHFFLSDFSLGVGCADHETLFILKDKWHV